LQLEEQQQRSHSCLQSRGKFIQKNSFWKILSRRYYV